MHEVALHIAAGAPVLARLAADTQVLDADEQGRAACLRFAEDRQSFCAAHVLLRQALSGWSPVSPSRWRFCRGTHGRPEVDTAALGSGPRLRFNLSHTRGLVCCAVTRDAPVGVDVECRGRVRDRLALARRFFHAEEAAAIAAESRAGEAAESASFYAFWTLKEAYVKSRGLGIAMGLDGFAFRLGDGDVPSIALEVDAQSAAPADRWHCLLLRLDGARCMLSLVLPVAAMVGVRPFWYAEVAAVEPDLALAASTPGIELLPIEVLDLSNHP